MRTATCRLCGGRLAYRIRRFAWVHVTMHGVAHPPAPMDVRDEREHAGMIGEDRPL